MPSLSHARCTRREAIAVGVGLLTGAASVRAEDAKPKLAAVTYDAPQPYRITHEATLKAGDGRLLSVEAWLPVPQDRPEQTVTNIKIEPRVAVVRDVTKLASFARFYQTRGLPKTGDSVTFRVSYDVTCRQQTTDWDVVGKPKFAQYKKDAAFQLFTRPEKTIETLHPDIKAKAAMLRGNREVVETARAIYDFVIDSTTYRFLNGIKGAGYCLKNGHGECTEYSALFVAICRAAGIPARPVLGCFGDKTNGWHAWAEFMLPSGQWIPLDPTNGDRNPQRRHNWFGHLENRRVSFGKTYDTDMKTGSTKRTRRHVDGLQFGAYWFQVTGLKPNARVLRPTFKVSGHRIESPSDNK